MTKTTSNRSAKLAAGAVASRPSLVYLERFNPGPDFHGLNPHLLEALEMANRPTCIVYDATRPEMSDLVYPLIESTIIESVCGEPWLPIIRVEPRIPVIALVICGVGTKVSESTYRHPKLLVPQAQFQDLDPETGEVKEIRGDPGLVDALASWLERLTYAIPVAQRNLLQRELHDFEHREVRGRMKFGARHRGGRHDDALFALAMALFLVDRPARPARNLVEIEDPRSIIGIDLGEAEDETAVAVVNLP